MLFRMFIRSHLCCPHSCVFSLGVCACFFGATCWCYIFSSCSAHWLLKVFLAGKLFMLWFCFGSYGLMAVGGALVEHLKSAREVGGRCCASPHDVRVRPFIRSCPLSFLPSFHPSFPFFPLPPFLRLFPFLFPPSLLNFVWSCQQ